MDGLTSLRSMCKHTSRSSSSRIALRRPYRRCFWYTFFHSIGTTVQCQLLKRYTILLPISVIRASFYSRYPYPVHLLRPSQLLFSRIYVRIEEFTSMYISRCEYSCLGSFCGYVITGSWITLPISYKTTLNHISYRAHNSVSSLNPSITLLYR